ncbi:MAG: glycoside hydrolase family 2 [Firmicutes bacterium]|nr:glycoside hydrolase family 2 [Bacillota bacterium]
MKKSALIDLYTKEGKELLRCREENPEHQPWTTYPRPKMKRDNWLNLNGTWDFQVSAEGTRPQQFEETILVPFPPQSLLSGIHREIPEEQYLFYRRTFRLEESHEHHRVILHLGAVDQMATVWVDDTMVGEHIGGYDHFSFDITEALAQKEEHELVIRALDQLSNYILPYGKQTNKRGGMWYTPVSGIWQTVWLEVVPEQYIRDLTVTNGSDWVEISADIIDAAATGEAGHLSGNVTVHAPEGEIAAELVDGCVRVALKEPRLWSPEDPYLYSFTVETGEDLVESYFALRTLETKVVGGTPRLCLNGKPYFFHGILDQGYWSDGLLTPADPACFCGDILAMKELGFNMLRKHIKVEPELFYYECDRLGMIVAQDMVNNGDYNFIRDTALPTVGMKTRDDRKLHKDPQIRKAFLTGMEATVAQLKNHPCICYWTIFNEGWGQFNSGEVYRKMKALDDTRFIDSTSGWFTCETSESDVISEHVYFKPVRVDKSTGFDKSKGTIVGTKPLVLSEFGGYCLPVENHIFNPDKAYGYKNFKTQEEYEKALIALYEEQIVPAVKQGLCGAVYTQVSDVEDEINGLLTYDRKTCKVGADEMRTMAEKLKL